MKIYFIQDFFKLLKVLQNKHLYFLFFSFILSIFTILIEMIGISIIPITVINFLDFEQNVFNNFLFDFLKTVEFKFFLFFLVSLFFLKSVITYLNQIYDFIIFKKIRISPF